MKRRLLAAAATILLIAGAANAQSAPKPAATSDAQPLAVLLEQGIYQEETAGNLEAAAKSYHQIVEQAAVGRALVAQALARLAALEVKQKQFDEARQTLERLKTEYPEQKDAIAKAAALLPNDNRVASGRSDHDEGPSEKKERAPNAEEKAKAAELAKEGWQLYRDGKNEAAAEAFRRAIQLDPKSIDGLNGVGWTLLNEGRVGGGPYFSNVLVVDPKNAMALNGMGWTMWNQSTGSKPNAIKYWQQAVEVDPTATSAMSGLAQNALETYQLDESIKWYEKWLSQDPTNVEASKGLERAKQAQKSVDEATRVALEFLKCVDEDRLDDAKKLLDDASSFMVGDQGNRRTWQSFPFDSVPLLNGFSVVKSDKWDEMMKDLRDPYGHLIDRKLNSVSGPNPRSPGASPFGETSGKGGRGVFGSRIRGIMYLNFTPQFENDRRAAETVTLQKTKDDEWKIHGYSITKPVVPRDPLKSQ
jgi:tetratricopeptide (TPR) repeat protein